MCGPQLKNFLTCAIVALCCISPWLSQVQGARILAVFPIPARSHLILGHSLLNELAARGHEVTLITALSQGKNVTNLKEIVVEEASEHLTKHWEKTSMFDMDMDVPLVSAIFVHKMGFEFTEIVFANAKVQNLLKSNAKFDLVIIENFNNEAHYVFAHHFQAPVVVFGTLGSGPWTNHLVGNPAPSAYVPSFFLKYKPVMSFLERVCNTLFNAYYQLVYNFHIYPSQNNLIKKYFPEAPELADMIYNTSLVLLNSHVSTAVPVPHVTNMIEIGGFHVQPAKPLPKDLQEYLDNAKEGVVYFSMGSNLKSVDMSQEKREAILKVFSQLKQKVLWKFEEDKMVGQTANVKIGKWLPQQDILAHPNVKVFITHGGLLSTTEAIYHGVPVIGIPIFGDQKMNIQAAQRNGYGLALQYRELTEETLGNALNEVLNNPEYTKNAKQRSRILHDQQNKPLDTAMFWIEYVIRHEGAYHLRSSAMELKHWYQYMLVDVILFLTVDVIVILFVLYVVAKKLCCKKSKKQEESKSTKASNKKQKRA